jgi:CheY-like chemotaxis protein
MSRVQLIHWNAPEAKERAGRIQAAGYKVAYEMPQGMALFRKLRDDPPIAVVIDLSRLPMQGRDVALALRHYKTTRHLPIVFVEGDPEKVARIKEKVPDAVYTTWTKIRSALKQAIAHPPKDPVVPQSLLDGYAGQPLVKKLSNKANSVTALVDAPPTFKKLLGALPEGARLREQARGQCDVMLWFVRSRKDLKRCVEQMAARDDFGALWIIWPKKASGMGADLSQQIVREAAMAAGLVDYKICSIDATWSGLLFTRRKAKKKN